MIHNGLTYQVDSVEDADGIHVTIERGGQSYTVKLHPSYIATLGTVEAYCLKTGFADAELFWNPPPPEEE